jgi:hypothetical protein
VPSRRLPFPCIVNRSLESPFRATPANETVSGAEGILLRLGRHVSDQWRCDSPNAKDNLGSILIQCQQPAVPVIRLALAPTAESGSNVAA